MFLHKVKMSVGSSNLKYSEDGSFSESIDKIVL